MLKRFNVDLESGTIQAVVTINYEHPIKGSTDEDITISCLVDDVSEAVTTLVNAIEEATQINEKQVTLISPAVSIKPK